MEENNELLVVNNEEDVTEMDSKMSGTTGAIIGSVLTIAAIAGVKTIKKMVAMRKAKKESIEEESINDTIDEYYDSEGNLK